MRVGIIGTAGRGSDAPLLIESLYRRALHAVIVEVAPTGPEHDGQSGGAAWIDHLAVILYLHRLLRSLTLFVPAPLNRQHAYFIGPAGSDAAVINRYHRAFSRALGVRNTIEQIVEAEQRGARIVEVPDGFKARNIPVGECDWLVACTFEPGCVPKDGGTRHCWDHSTASRKIHIPLGAL